MEFCGIQLRSIWQKVLQIVIFKMGLKIMLLKLPPHFPGPDDESVVSGTKPISFILFFFSSNHSELKKQ